MTDGRGAYTIGDWAMVSLSWAPPSRWVRFHWEGFFPDVRREYLFFNLADMQVNAWELEWRPHPIVGLKFERTRSVGLSTWGLILRPEKEPMRALYLEVNAGHDWILPSAPAWLFGDDARERSGAHASLSLGAGM